MPSNSKNEPRRQNTTIDCNVQSILGITEPKLVQLSSRERRAFISENNDAFVNVKTGKLTRFGCFEPVKLSQLCAEVEPMSQTDDQKDPSGRQPSPCLTTASGIDIGELQGTLTTRDAAMVQVASNFNCLENPSVHSSADSGYLVDMACRDSTQGPAACFAALSAYLYRAHFYGCQRDTKEVNLLEHVSNYFGIPVNGKLILKGDEEKGVSIDSIDDITSQISIGLHKDCPILFRRTGKTITAMESDRDIGSSSSSTAGVEYPLVDQVFNASINISHYGRMSQASLSASGGNEEKAAHTMARTLLRAAYEGIYIAAIARQRKTLLLTLVGGGSFCNPIRIIVEELERAHNKWVGHYASKLEKCVICLYSEEDEREVKKYLGNNNKSNYIKSIIEYVQSFLS